MFSAIAQQLKILSAFKEYKIHYNVHKDSILVSFLSQMAAA
jgi:hypothetical protein